MSLLRFFNRKPTAPVARERLQLLLAHERALSGREDLAAVLQEEILAVIAKHIQIDREKVNVKLDRGEPGFDPGNRYRDAGEGDTEEGLSGSFLKKRTKKFLPPGAWAVSATPPMPQV